MAMIYRYKWERYVWFFVISAIALIALYSLFSPLVHGDDSEDKLGPTWPEWLQKRAAEWNINTLINDTLETAERFEPEK